MCGRSAVAEVMDVEWGLSATVAAELRELEAAAWP